mgnify:CR=1 FL=1
MRHRWLRLAILLCAWIGGAVLFVEIFQSEGHMRMPMYAFLLPIAALGAAMSILAPQNAIAQVCSSFMMWFTGSTVIGVLSAFLVNIGHGAVVFLVLAWIVGAIGFAFHCRHIVKTAREAKGRMQ